MKKAIVLIAVLAIVGLSAQAFAQQVTQFDKKNPSGKYVTIQLAQPLDVPVKQCWGNAIFPENVVSAKWQRVGDRWERQVVFRNLTFQSADTMLQAAPGLREAIETHLAEIAPREGDLPRDPAADVALQQTWRVAQGGSWEVIPRNFAKK